MSTKFSFNKIKGRVAETVIKELFLLNDYNVFNYGMELTMPGIAVAPKNSKSKLAKNIRFMPDYVVQSKRSGELSYVEVKFRANGKFSIEELDADYPYKNAWFIIVAPGRIQVMHFSTLKKGKQISPATGYELSKVKAFHLSPEMVEEFEKFTATLFKGF